MRAGVCTVELAPGPRGPWRASLDSAKEMGEASRSTQCGEVQPPTPGQAGKGRSPAGCRSPGQVSQPRTRPGSGTAGQSPETPVDPRHPHQAGPAPHTMSAPGGGPLLGRDTPSADTDLSFSGPLPQVPKDLRFIFPGCCILPPLLPDQVKVDFRIPDKEPLHLVCDPGWAPRPSKPPRCVSSTPGRISVPEPGQALPASQPVTRMCSVLGRRLHATHHVVSVGLQSHCNVPASTAYRCRVVFHGLGMTHCTAASFLPWPLHGICACPMVP